MSIEASSAAADAQKQQMDYQAAVARNNSILADNAAADATARGQVAEQQQAAAGAQLIGKEKATLAQNGVDVNSGSALDITTDTAGENKLDQLTILSNAERESIGYQNQAGSFNSQAALDTAAADNSSNFGAGVGTALSGAGSVAQKWYNYSSQGGSPSSGFVNSDGLSNGLAQSGLYNDPG